MSNRKLGFGLGVSLLALTAAAPALGGVQPYGLNIPSAGAVDFGQINPTTGAFTFISQLPSGQTLPLGIYTSNPIVGEFYVPNPTDTLAVNGQSGTSRSLGSNLTILGFDVASDRLIADKLDGTGNHIVSIDPVSLTQVQQSPAFAPAGQIFVTGAAAVNSINREVYTLSGSTLLVTNLDTGAAIRSVALSQNVAGTFAFDPLNGTLYDFAVPSIGDFRLASIDPTTGHVSVISTTNVLPGGISNMSRSLSVVDGAIYVQSSSGVYDIVDLATGTLKSSFTSSATTIFSQDQVVLGGASNSTFAFDITNPNAALYKVGPGAVVLTGSNGNTGGTSILAGTLQIGNGGTAGSLAGDVINNGSLVFDRSDSVIFSGAISGTGSLAQTGGGTLRLDGANTYTGGTTIGNGATLQIGSGGTTGSIFGNVTNNGTLVFDRSDAVTFSGVISGTGSLTQSVGTLILIGANTYTGGTDTGTGTIQIGNGGTTGSIAGNVTDRTALVFDRSDSITFAGVISGAGVVRQIGTGVTTLSATNTYTGGTAVSAGTLNVTGSIAGSAVSVASGAKLTGTGKTGAVTVASGGTLSPGAGGAPSTLTVQGNLALASGANYVDPISPTVTGLTNVSGSATVNGTLTVSMTPGAYVIGQRYTVLTAAGGVSGTFASVGTSSFGAYKPTAGYDANSVFVTFSPNALSPFLPTPTGANGSGAAKAIDAAIASGAPLNSGFNVLFGLSGAALGNAVTQLSGETGADAAQGGSQAFLPFVSTLMAEGISGSPTMTAANFAPGNAYGEEGAPKPAQLAAGAMRAWGTVYGRHTGIAADAAAGTQSLKAGDVGFAAGIEMQVSDNLRLGAAAGGGHGTFNAGNGLGSSDDAMLGVYGNLGVMDQGYVAGAFSYGWHDVDTLRLLTISGTDLLSAKYTAHDVGVRVEGGWRVALDEEDGLVPYAAFVWDSFQAPAYGERAVSGSANFALSYASHDTDFGQSELGLKAGRAIAMGNGMMALELSAAWAHQLYGAPFALVSFQALPGSNFVVQGGRIATDTALLGAGFDWRENDALSFGARIDSQLGGGTTALAGTGTISLRF